MRSEWNQAAHRGREWPSRLDMLSCHDEAVTTVPADTALARGYGALAVGNWSEARGAFEEAVRTVESPEALDGLGRSLWWLHEGREAIVCRERAYSGFRRDGDLGRAARIALWLSREYSLVFGNNAAARGWLARAERLLRDVAPGVEQGWLDLARSEGSRESSEAAMYAESALNAALTASDPDLELRALAQLGFARVSGGEVDEGLAELDEAMAAATSGEPASLDTFADICCTLMLACEQAGDMERPQQWSAVLEDFVRKYDHVVLLAFCRTCCADVFAANGRVDAAEEELVAAIKELTDAGQRSRCVNPAARLAEIRVLQGRFDEAEELLVGFDGEPDATRAAVGLRLARGEPAPAAVILERRLDEVGRSSVLAVPLLDQLVDARLAEGRLEDASVAAAAVSELQKAINHFTVLGLRLDAARCRLALARTLASESPEIAIDTARQARNELEALGDSREADIAAALMRSLGAKGRAGPRATGLLTQREIEVLRLLREGLTNAEIAARLFISPKTAEHHVSRIFAKLGLSKRSEAAAYAVRHLEAE
jgi:DNA-binding NarL/FixJ family response regulator/predicted negative regulator of RcsB-dependent stress response